MAFQLVKSKTLLVRHALIQLRHSATNKKSDNPNPKPDTPPREEVVDDLGEQNLRLATQQFGV